MGDIGGGLHPAVDGQSLDEDEENRTDVQTRIQTEGKQDDMDSAPTHKRQRPPERKNSFRRVEKTKCKGSALKFNNPTEEVKAVRHSHIHKSSTVVPKYHSLDYL